MKTSLTILGSAAGIPSPDRSNAGYILETDDDLLMVDCGSGATSAFLRAGFDPDKLEGIIITHMHSDHVCDLPLFIQMLKHSRGEFPVTIYVPEEALEILKKYMIACYLFPEKMPFRVIFKPVEELMEFHSGKLNVNAIPNKHFINNEKVIRDNDYPNRMECYSLRFTIENKVLLYSSDVYSLDDIKKYIDNLDLLVVESSHIDLDELRSILSQKRVEKLVLTHIGEDDKDRVEKFISHPPGVSRVIKADDNLTVEF